MAASPNASQGLTAIAGVVTGVPPLPETPAFTVDPFLTPFTGLETPTPGAWAPLQGTAVPGMLTYEVQDGDTLGALAGRFGVPVDQIVSAVSLSAEGFLAPGQVLYLPDHLDETPYPSPVFPDSEVTYSPSSVGFDVRKYVQEKGGYLSIYAENLKDGRVSGADIVQRIATEFSVDPRLLLALIEYRSHWVTGQPSNPNDSSYPLGFHVAGQEGLYRELVMAATHLNIGFYGWRTGTVVETKFIDGSRARFSPQLNAGSVAVQNLLAKLFRQEEWRETLYGKDNFLLLYQQMFGDPWARADSLGLLFPIGLTQPPMELPFAPGKRWSLTGGPHPSWKTGSPPGALDFAPVTGEPKCAVSKAWILASAAGLVVRSERNVVAIDLDGDGYEQTGWVIIYMHVADQERIMVGSQLKVDDSIGHPSCEGGVSTGTHVHIARKYNGEWIAADGPLPFFLSGWRVYAYEKNYFGELRKDDRVVVASPVGSGTSIIIRQ